MHKNEKETDGIASTAVLVLLFLYVSAFAETQKNYIADEAGLLTEEQRKELNAQAAQLSNICGCGIYVITLDDFTKYVDTDKVGEAAKILYREYELGMDEEHSGILLLLSVAERDYDLRVYGYGNTAFTDFGKDYLAEAFLDNFGKDDWLGGFKDYLSTAGEMIQSARDGAPVDTDNVPDLPYARVFGVTACVLMGFAIAFLVRDVLKGQLKSVKMGTNAEAFIVSGGLHLTEQYDRYTHTTQAKVYDPPKENKSGSAAANSGGTTVDSDGSSGKSGKF